MECTNDTHCDDGNPCTVDACGGTIANTCDNTPVPAGDTGMCTGGEVCSGTPTNTCGTCADTDASGAATDAGCTQGAPFCDVDGSGRSCEVCVDDGAGTDLGCAASAPNCVVGTGGANACITCTTGADCGDGNECTEDVCTAGVCTNPALPEFTPCTGGVCTQAAVCMMTGPDAGVPDAGMLPDGGVASGVGGLSGGAMCATHAPVGASWPAAGGLLLVGLALATRRRRR